MLIPFLPRPGLNSDDTTFAAEGQWADGNNFRFVNGLPQVRGGMDTLFSLSVSSSTCRAILPFNRSGSVSIAYGLANDSAGSGTAKLYVGSGLSSPSDRTPAGLGTSIFNWSLAAWGSTLLASPEGGTLYEQSGTGTATEVTQAPDRITHMLVTPQRQVLALGCNEEVSGTFNGLCIRGCDIEDYSDWTTSATNNAFEYILDGAGLIVAGRIIGSYVAAWTTGALWLGQFVGDPSQTYRFDKVADNCGLAGPNAVVVFNGTASWLGPDYRLRMWSPGALPEIMACPIFKDFTTGLDALRLRYVVASANSRFNEVRFDYFDSRGTGYPSGVAENRYISVCLYDGTWHRGAGGYSAILDSGELSSLTTSYIGGPTIIGASASSTIAVDLVDTGELEWGAAGSSPMLKPSIQSADMYLDSSQRRVMVRGCIPDFKDQSASIELNLLVRDRPKASATTKGPWTLTTTTTKKDFRASGKLFAVKLAGVSTSLYVRLGKLVFDVVSLGTR